MPSDAHNRCWSCKEALPDGAKFCLQCGKPQSEGPSPRNTPSFVDQTTAPDATRLDNVPTRLIPPGTRLGVYVIEACVGEGGMGVVYRARDEANQRTVAVKTLHTNFIAEPGIRRRFSREARLMTARNHPNMVKVFDTIEHDDLLAIVMEFVDGPSLAAWLERWGGQLPWEELRLVFDGILSAMEAAHEVGVIHRDLKPDNILLQPDEAGPNPKVADFGVAKVTEGTQFTVTGAVLGTCRYMSPEQVESPDTIDHRTDVYSLGVTLYQLCTGRCPFETTNNFALMMAHVRQEPPRPSLYRADMPPALEALILAALAKDPSVRPQSCAEFKARLREALANVVTLPPRGRRGDLEPVVAEADGSELVLVSPGPFQMGPSRRTVHLDAFYMARRPVTNRQFARFVETTGYRPEDAHRYLAHWHRGKPPSDLLDHPVVFVSWHDACAYCAWAGRRLPTEAEWEKAARGTDGRKYPWGRETPTAHHANFGRHLGTTAPVDAFGDSASPWGCEGMAGNVWEWCEDVDDPRFYLHGPGRNPRNTVQPGDAPRVVRGGSWLYDAASLRTFARSSFQGHFRLDGVGFRVVMA